MIKSVYLAIAAATMTLALAPGPLKADQVANGKRLAERLCAHCHVVTSEPAEAPKPLPFAQQEPPFPEAQRPRSFPQLAGKIPLSEDYIHTTLRNPHPNMVRFRLSASMVSDLVAYLRSLKLKAEQAKRRAERKAEQAKAKAKQVANGKRLAQRWCSNCHIVASEEAPAGPKAPPFPQMANNILLSEAYLDSRLRNPHPAMDKFEPTAPMVSDLVAYLRSFKVKEDEAANGKLLAERFCAGCHVVGSEPAAGRTAPPFPQLANSRDFFSQTFLDYWLRNPNPPMHPFELPEPRVAEIVAYLLSLKK